MPSGSASRKTSGATSATSTPETVITRLRTPPAPGSVPHLRDRAQLLGRGRAEAEEFEVGRDLLEEHVLAYLHLAALVQGGPQERRDLLLHDHLPDERRRGYPVDVHRQGVVVLHPEGGGIDDDVVALGVFGARR